MNIENVKFKVWDSESKRMSLPFNFDDSAVCFTDGDFVPMQFAAGKAQTTKRFEFLYFTTLTDKNGVEIYEGDILKINTLFSRELGSTASRAITAEVVFKDGCFWFEDETHLDCNWQFNNTSNREVIGNI